MGATIVWFRQDLRLDDNPALRAAAARGNAVVPVYVWAPQEEAAWAPGGASRWWLHHSLLALDAALRQRGSRLVVRRGVSAEALTLLVRETRAEAVLWNRRYEPAAVRRDEALRDVLQREGVAVDTFNASLLFEPWELKTRTGTPYQVFTPFWRACQAAGAPAQPQASPVRIAAPRRWPDSLSIDSLGLLPSIDWARGLRESWTPGEAGARAALDQFIASGLARYDDDRNRPDVRGSSRLSPHLHWGEISPCRVWHAVRTTAAARGRGDAGRHADAFRRELAWREFAYHLLHHFPHTPGRPLRDAFSRFPWKTNRRALHAWQRGRTGYPIVDAGMRELWATGWMHNRVRMIVASFLVKDLLISWRQGAAWFWDTLVDADLANNTLGWQWTAGCGADAAPYFRVFNPVLQGLKFDPDGEYVRQWVPELRSLAVPFVHRPWTADAGELAAAGVRLGRDYPKPIVDHDEARQRALAAYRSMSSRRA